MKTYFDDIATALLVLTYAVAAFSAAVAVIAGAV